MAIEARRGCGYRKVGGIYLMGERGGQPCCKMPIELCICPTCGSGARQSMGWTWIDPRPWIKGECTANYPLMTGCPIGSRIETLGDKVGLLWVGTRFYPTPEHFSREADTMGISRRIKSIPRGFEVGVSWVFLAHPKCNIRGEVKPGVFKIFRPNRVEKIVTESQSRDEELMTQLEMRRITPVVVPDNDRDHQGSVYDDDREESLPLEEAAQ